MNSESNSKQAMWVAIGQFFSYAIGIVSPMVLSRYFDKGDYGTYKQVMYVYTTLITVFAFGLPRAYSYFIPRVKIGESKDVVKKITNIFLVLGVAFSLILFLFAGLIADLLNNSDLEMALKYFSPTPLFLLPVMGYDCIMAAYKKTQFIAIYSIFTKIFTLLCIILPVVFFHGNYIHAIVGFDIASFLSFLLALYLRNIPVKNIEIEKSTVTIKEILQFSVPLIIASVWMMIYQSANQFFVSRYYGNEVFADFSNGFIEFPIIPMVINSVATVLLPVFSGMAVNNRENIKTVWINALTKSIKLIYPIAVYSIVFANIIMTCFYGDLYESSGIYFIVKNLEGFFIVVPFYPILLALGKTKQYSNIHLIMAIAIFPLEYLVVLFKLSAVMIGVVYVFCSFIKVLLQFFVVSKAVEMNVNELIPFGQMIKILVISFIASVLPMLMTHYMVSVNKFFLLFFSVAFYVVCYYILCWITKISYKDVVGGYISGGVLKKLIRFVP